MVMFIGNGMYGDNAYGYQQRQPNGYQSVVYDPKTGQMMRPNPAYNGLNQSIPQYIPVGGLEPGPTTYTPPAVDFNALPKQTIAQAQPYVRPNAPAQNTGSGYRPQFDPSFIQQMLAQRFGNQQPNAGVPTMTRPTGPATLTPGATQTYGGVQGPSGLAGLRSIAGGTPNAVK